MIFINAYVAFMYCVSVIFVKKWIESLYSSRVSDFLKMSVRGPQHKYSYVAAPSSWYTWLNPSVGRHSWNTPCSPSGAEVLHVGIWGPRMTSWALLRLERFTSPCETQQLFVDIWDLQLRASLYISRNHYISYFNSGTQRQLLMTQNVTEWMVGIILQKSFSDAPNDTRTILERLPRKIFSLFRNFYFSLKARELPLVKMAAQRQLPTSS